MVYNVQPTAYGEVSSDTCVLASFPHCVLLHDQTFEVITDKNPANIAYSTDALHLHMDLTFYESVPGLQLLHCIRYHHYETAPIKH